MSLKGPYDARWVWADGVPHSGGKLGRLGEELLAGFQVWPIPQLLSHYPGYGAPEPV